MNDELAKVGDFVQYNKNVNLNVNPYVLSVGLISSIRRIFKHGEIYLVEGIEIDYGDTKGNSWYWMKISGISDWYPCISFSISPRACLMKKYNLR